VVTPDGKIKTVVNMAGTKGLKGGDGPAADCQMNGPKHIQIDRNENVLIADAENHQILKYNPKSATTQVITGTGKAGTAGLGGPARQAQVNRPHGIVEAANGDYIITDSYNNRVLRIKN
jgi:streptogramin lyase